MKKILTVFSLFLTFQWMAQTTAADMNNKLFLTYEDYKNNKPLEGVELIRIVIGGILIFRNEQKEKLKPEEMPAPFFTDDKGFLVRIFKGNVYFVLIEGPYTYYLDAHDAWLSYQFGMLWVSDPNYTFGTIGDFYSETISGDIKRFQPKDFLAILEKNGLKEEYLADKVKRDRYDTPNGYESKVVNHYAKYFLLLNEKLK